MDSTTSIITSAISICILALAVAAVAGSLYGILVWYPAYRRQKVEALKAAGRQGEATILRVPRYGRPNSHAAFTMIDLGLEIRVLGIDPYQVDKLFTFPTHALDRLEEGQVVPVWVDPHDPRNPDKIVIDID